MAQAEVQAALDALMAEEGAVGYVLVNFDGIPVMKHPKNLPAVQYAALISDLVMKTKSTLKQLNQTDNEFVYLRMRTKQDTELIVTDFITPGTSYEYILVCIQSCKFGKDDDEEGEEQA